jgi:hypothetical protein
MRIDGNISDLFFNTDVSVAAIHDERGQFVEWDHNKLRDEAQMFLNCLARLNVPIPSIDDLTADFYGRI